MKMIETIEKQYQQLQSKNGCSVLTSIEQNAFNAFKDLGIPGARHEEWKYTRISNLFNKQYAFIPGGSAMPVSAKDINAIRLPGHKQANELVFVNGLYSAALST